MADPAAETPKEDLGLWFSKLQAEALDALGVPHPPLNIPKTEEQCSFWRHFGRTVEFLPDEELDEMDLLEALSEEWTAVATIAEVVRAHGQGCNVVWVLGPSPSLEYRSLEALEHQLAMIATGWPRLIFCGPEVPGEIHGRCVAVEGVRCEHWKGYWHDVADHLELEEVTGEAQLFIALNAGTSVRDYQKHWETTLLRLPASASVYITGYNLAEVEDAENDLKRMRPETRCLRMGPCRSGTLKGFDRLELGRTPSSFPGKANYGECLAMLGPKVPKLPVA
eukprot:s2384_g9.t1